MQKQSSQHGFSPHHHTGHVLPRHRTSFPVLAMILLCVGVLLAGWTRLVTADPVTYSKSDSYVVRASVPGPAPSVAATIDNPTDSEKFTSTPVNVSGTCPDSTYVVLYRNNVMSGVSLCDTTGNWHVTSDLFVGSNKLKAIDYSFTDVAGPDSAIVAVNYQPSVPSGTLSTESKPTASSGSPETVPAGATPLVLKSDFSFQGYYVGSEIEWQLIVDGGNAPYAVAVDWGDGTNGLVSRPTAGSFVFKHTYKKTGGYHGSYAPIFTATDADGQQTALQLLAIVSNRPTPSAATSTDQGNTFSGMAAISGQNIARYLKYVWPSYFIIVLMLVSYWLGENREYRVLKPRLRKTGH
ncbi:MAG: hypothetical protein JWO41_406 [Candidatus Saccharibacteria bacterium]|nr:hypothetical protein [Candidatus Saccharibacteria bacterium]